MRSTRSRGSEGPVAHFALLMSTPRPCWQVVKWINPGKRYATDGVRAYCGHEHAPGAWHGFPVEWRRVPPSLRDAWLKSRRVSKRHVKERW